MDGSDDGYNESAWKYYEQLVKKIEDIVILIRDKISTATRVIVGALAVVYAHAITLASTKYPRGPDLAV